MESILLTPEQMEIAARINAHMLTLEQAGVVSDLETFGEMVNEIRGFEGILNSAPQEVMDELCRHFPGFQRYVSVVMTIALRVGHGGARLP